MLDFQSDYFGFKNFLFSCSATIRLVQVLLFMRKGNSRLLVLEFLHDLNISLHALKMEIRDGER